MCRIENCNMVIRIAVLIGILAPSAGGAKLDGRANEGAPLDRNEDSRAIDSSEFRMIDSQSSPMLRNPILWLLERTVALRGCL